MNNELTTIIDLTIAKLEQLDQSDNIQYRQKLEEVKTLQKQLLNSSVLQKPQLESEIKAQLQTLELQLWELRGKNQAIELAFLVEYIKENYE
ncbi:hypothetical protein RZE82_09170 [Mollicutes bacterium LVI A0039]|nr:hypothetical protein RZE82_09170 [Mollicutes bacterium LVI A0039]